MSNEEILAELNKGMTALHNGIKNVNQALSSANIAVGQVEAYNKGLEDAWECVKKLTVNDYLKDGYDSDELLKIFGTDNIFCILKNYTPQEALAKLEAYEKEQAEIKVGDVVTIFPRSGGQYDAIVVFKHWCVGIFHRLYIMLHYAIFWWRRLIDVSMPYNDSDVVNDTCCNVFISNCN